MDARRLARARRRSRSSAACRSSRSADPTPTERRYLDEVWQGAIADPSADVAGETSRCCRGARVYVGPDTSVTHLAAAAGCPTVALFGPTRPARLGTWPVGGLDAPWQASGTIQHRGNVWIVQNPLPCLPCTFEGCERHIESASVCLQELARRTGAGRGRSGAGRRPLNPRPQGLHRLSSGRHHCRVATRSGFHARHRHSRRHHRRWHRQGVLHRRRGDRGRPHRRASAASRARPGATSTPTACWSRPAGSMCTRTTTARRCGTRCWRRHAGTASRR